MNISWGKNKVCTCKKISIPQEFFGTPRWPLFHCFGTLILTTMGSHEQDLGSRFLACTFLNPIFATKHGNSIAKGCKLLFGLVARETWLKLLLHVYNFSCYRLLSVPYNFNAEYNLWQKKVPWGMHVSETKQTVFLFAPLCKLFKSLLIFGSFCFQVSPSIRGVHQDWGPRSACILLWSLGEPNCT